MPSFAATGGPPQEIFEPPSGDWTAVSSPWSQTSGQPSTSLQNTPTAWVPSLARAPMRPQPAVKSFPDGSTQSSLPSGSARTTCPSSGR